jgi:hypothetical protein
VPHESLPHAFVIAKSRPLRRLDHAAEFAAFEQQPRGLRLDPVSRCAIGGMASLLRNLTAYLSGPAN